MIPFSLEEIACLAPGRLVAAPGATQVTGLEIDSRRCSAGDLFVAIRGGRGFVEDALARGAAAAVVPEDPHGALAAIGRAIRDRTGARVVAITGSTGKTTTKDILAGLCRPHLRTIASEGSHNNEIGLPLTLGRLDADSELAIVEMGMRGLGQVAELCRIARPDVSVITAVGPVHLELLGSLENVAAAKAEIVRDLAPGGTAIVPAAEPLLDPHLEARDDVGILRTGPGGDVRLLGFERGAPHSRLEVDVLGTELSLELSVRSRHAATNALAAIAAYAALGLPLERLGEGARAVVLSPWRDQEAPLPDGGLLLADCYNANPISMRAALAHLRELAAGRRMVAVLGDMAELGPDAPLYHREIGEEAVRTGVAAVVAVGELARHYVDGAARVGGTLVTRWAPDAGEALAAVRDVLEPGDAVLVKASRSMRLETLAEALVGSPA